MLRDRFCLTVLAIALVLSASAAQAKNINVCASGGTPYSTIQEGVNAAAPGDTVQVCAGSYVENVIVSTPDLKIVGQGSLGSVVLTCDIEIFPGFWISNSSRDEIRNFDISGCDPGLYITGGSAPATGNLIVHNRILSNARFGIVVNGFSGASNSELIGNQILTDNTADANGVIGIYADPYGSSNAFIGNNAHGNGFSSLLPPEGGTKGDVRDDDNNTWKGNSCDTAVNNASCVPSH